jgi:NAD(P)H-dependent FMN reductase
MRVSDLPFYNQDDHDLRGLANGAEVLRTSMEMFNGIVISSPVYNSSIYWLLKNVIGCVGRYNSQPSTNNTYFFYLFHSPSLATSVNYEMYVPLDRLVARVFPEMFSLEQAYYTFNQISSIANEQLKQQSDMTTRAFVDLTEEEKII